MVLSGYYGFGNTGDEAVLAGIVRSMAEQCPKAELTALSADPAYTRELHGIRAVNRMRFGEVIEALKEADLLISGGGSLIQDVTSSRSLLYYLAVIWLAKRLKKKVMIYAQGIGPLAGVASRRLTKLVLNQVDLITVRDDASKFVLRGLGINRPEIHVTADPSFAMAPVPPDEADELLRAAGVPEGMPLIGVSLRPWKDQEKWLPALARGLDSAASRIGAALVFLPMQRDWDLGMSVQMASEMSAPSAVIAENINPSQVMAVMGKMSLVVGMRLHSLIMAAANTVPFVGITYDPKVEAFANVTAQDELLSTEGLSTGEVMGRIIEAWERRQELAVRMNVKVESLKAAASQNAEMACHLLGL